MVRCADGTQLTPSTGPDTDATVTGSPWTGLDPAATATIVAADHDIETFVLQGVQDDCFLRPTGTSGPQDLPCS